MPIRAPAGPGRPGPVGVPAPGSVVRGRGAPGRGSRGPGRTPFTLSGLRCPRSTDCEEAPDDAELTEADTDDCSDIDISEAGAERPASASPASPASSGSPQPAPGSPGLGPALGPAPTSAACSWGPSPCLPGHWAMAAPGPSRLHVIWIHRHALPLPVQWYSCLLWGVVGGMVGGALGGVLGGSLGLVVNRSAAGATAATIGGAIGAF